MVIWNKVWPLSFCLSGLSNTTKIVDWLMLSHGIPVTDKGEIAVVGVCLDCLDNAWLGHRQMQFSMQPHFHRTLMPTEAVGGEKYAWEMGFTVFGINLVVPHKSGSHIAWGSVRGGNLSKFAFNYGALPWKGLVHLLKKCRKTTKSAFSLASQQNPSHRDLFDSNPQNIV